RSLLVLRRAEFSADAALAGLRHTRLQHLRTVAHAAGTALRRCALGLVLSAGHTTGSKVEITVPRWFIQAYYTPEINSTSMEISTAPESRPIAWRFLASALSIPSNRPE